MHYKLTKYVSIAFAGFYCLNYSYCSHEKKAEDSYQNVAMSDICKKLSAPAKKSLSSSAGKDSLKTIIEQLSKNK